MRALPRAHRARAGRHLGAVCRAIHRQDGEAGVRRIQGVLSLAKKHGLAVVDEVCAEALAVELPTYRFVRRAVERRPSLPLTLTQVDPLIRELTLCFHSEGGGGGPPPGGVSQPFNRVAYQLGS